LQLLTISCDSDDVLEKQITQLQVTNEGDQDQILAFTLKSTDSSLSLLDSFPGYLTPEFTPEVTNYYWMVHNHSFDEDSFTLRPVPGEAAATMLLRSTDMKDEVMEQVR
jgi:hypothetical protein